MALVYATDLQLFDGADPVKDAQPEGIIEILAVWARVVEPMKASKQEGTRGGTVEAEPFWSDTGQLIGWRLQMIHADNDEDGVLWTVTATLTLVGATRLAIRVDRSRIGAQLKPLASQPKPPAFIWKLLQDDRFVVIDGTFDVSDEHYLVTESRAKRFADFLLSPDRRLPVVGYTPREDDVLDANSFVSETLGVAHVALIRPEASWALTNLLPGGTNVYAGAVRVWWPGLTSKSHRWDHPLWTADQPSKRVYYEVSDTIRRVAVSVPPRDPYFARLQTLQRRRERNALRAELETYESLLEEAGATETSGKVQAALAGADAAEELAAEAEERAVAAEQLVRELTAERDHYRHEIERRQALPNVPAELTPESEFCAALDERIVSLGLDVEPRDYRLGRLFMETLEALGESYRPKTLKTAAAVVARDLNLLAQVEDHPLRSSSGGNAPARTRSTDGAEAHRAYLEKRTPSARRLHYWLLPDKSVELASVNLHDDMEIPE